MHLYIHIPFCHRICPYCSFYKHTPGDTDIKSFIQAIGSEAIGQDTIGKISTLYLGGGTPSMLSPGHLQALFDKLNQAFYLGDTHITLEANPATFGPAKATLFKNLGVNRTSLGIQSFSPHVLNTLGREHNPDQAVEAVHILRDAGMEEINIDLMFAIPGQSISDWKETLNTAVSLNPDHISAYNLTYEEDTYFIDRLTQGEYTESEDTNADHYQIAHDTLTQAGFHHYETSNYAQPGKESKHNIGYWEGDDYLGLGPSAVSTILGERWKNLPDTPGYIHAMETVGHAMREAETISDDAFRIERIALLLRTSKGLPLRHLGFSPEDAIEELLENNLAEIKDGYFRLINNGPLLVDPIVSKLI